MLAKVLKFNHDTYLPYESIPIGQMGYESIWTDLITPMNQSCIVSIDTKNNFLHSLPEDVERLAEGETTLVYLQAESTSMAGQPTLWHNPPRNKGLIRACWSYIKLLTIYDYMGYIPPKLYMTVKQSPRTIH